MEHIPVVADWITEAGGGTGRLVADVKGGAGYGSLDELRADYPDVNALTTIELHDTLDWLRLQDGICKAALTYRCGPGDGLGPGTYHINRTLRVSGKSVSVRGRGKRKTALQGS